MCILPVAIHVVHVHFIALNIPFVYIHCNNDLFNFVCVSRYILLKCIQTSNVHCTILHVHCTCMSCTKLKCICLHVHIYYNVIRQFLDTLHNNVCSSVHVITCFFLKIINKFVWFGSIIDLHILHVLKEPVHVRAALVHGEYIMYM